MAPKTFSLAHVPQSILPANALVSTLTTETLFFTNVPLSTTPASTSASIPLQIPIHTFQGVFLAPETSFPTDASQPITPVDVPVGTLTLEIFFFANAT